jgi:hypothetical protein
VRRIFERKIKIKKRKLDHQQPNQQPNLNHCYFISWGFQIFKRVENIFPECFSPATIAAMRFAFSDYAQQRSLRERERESKRGF